MSDMPHFPNKELYDQLRAKEREVDSLTQKVEVAKGNFKKLELCDMVKTVVDNFTVYKQVR